MKNFKDLKKRATQESFRQKKSLREGDVVMSAVTGDKGKIYRAGVNYAICVTESGEMFRAWVKDLREVAAIDSINKERKSSIFTNNGKTKTNDKRST
jgi:hypothetical protein